jgi:hypothetical protein
MITTQDVQILIGRSVELVCFAKYGVYIHLQDQILLTVEADLEHVHGDMQERQLTTFPASQSSIMRLLERSVTSATAASNGAFQLIFSNDDSLRIEKRPEFESYQLRIGDEELTA